MTSDRKHPSAAFWLTAALVAVLVAYPLSFGPACWLTGSTVSPVSNYVKMRRIPHVYWLVGWAAQNGTRPILCAINWYATVGVGSDAVYCDTERDASVGGIVFMAAFEK